MIRGLLIGAADANWEALHFKTRDAQGGAGSWVSAAEVLDGMLVLAGEAGGQAAFWWAEQ